MSSQYQEVVVLAGDARKTVVENKQSGGSDILGWFSQPLNHSCVESHLYRSLPAARTKQGRMSWMPASYHMLEKSHRRVPKGNGNAILFFFPLPGRTMDASNVCCVTSTLLVSFELLIYPTTIIHLIRRQSRIQRPHSRSDVTHCRTARHLGRGYRNC